MTLSGCRTGRSGAVDYRAYLVRFSMSGVYKIKSESMYGLLKITFELQPSLSASSIPQKWDEQTEGAKYTATIAGSGALPHRRFPMIGDVTGASITV